MWPCAIPDRTSRCRSPGRSRALVAWLPDSWLVATGLAAEPVDWPAQTTGSCSTRRQSSRSASLKVTPEGRSYVIKVALHLGEPEKGRHVVNAAANRYVDMLRKRRSARPSSRPNGWPQRLDELRAEVETAEGAVERYRAEQQHQRVNGVTLNEQRLFDVNQRLSPLRADDAAAKAKIAQIQRDAHRGFDAARGGARSAVVADDHQSARAETPTAQGGVRAAQHLRRQASADRQHPAGEGDARSARSRPRSSVSSRRSRTTSR